MTPEAKDKRLLFEGFLSSKLPIGEDPSRYSRSLDRKIKQFYQEKLGKEFVSIYELADANDVYKVIQDLAAHPTMVYRPGRRGDSRIEGLNWFLAFLNIPKRSGEVQRPRKDSIRLATPEMEGKHIKIEQTVIRRNPEARRRCIESLGCRCVACNLVMSDKYGHLADGVIEVHHLVPIHLYDEAHPINPLTDLIPLCPNCHTMIHKLEDPGDIEGLKRLIEENRQS